ncbi:MAG: 50S ribosomal protein L29 [Candidatus Eutrophobiaceae bacterium]
MDIKELRGKDIEQLRGMLRDELRAHFNLRLQRGMMPDNIVPSEFQKTRCNIARIKTTMREKIGS